MTRPPPPAHLLENNHDPLFVPAPELRDWAFASFIAEDAIAENPDHAHLRFASIGMLWTNVQNSRHGMSIAGQAEFKPPGGTMGKWQRARAEAQLHEWFGEQLDFLLTFDARYASICTDAEFCALIEHELYHCGQAKDLFGAPKFSPATGAPVFAMRGHDVEEFLGVARRYGAVTPALKAMALACDAGPELEQKAIRAACGSCQAPLTVT
jgi:hypothetical protein